MTEKTQPTDTELDALIAEYRKRIYPQDMQPRFKRAIMRAAIAKWGPAPAVEEEQVGWMWQHDETGRTGFVNCGQVENGWQEINPRLRLVSRLYTTPQPTQPPAVTEKPVAFLVCTEEGDPDMVFLDPHEAQQYLEDHEQPIPLYRPLQPTQPEE